MNVLIIGGSGFVSGTLARASLELGHKVWAVTRGKRPLAPGVTPLVADRKDPASFAQAIQSAGVAWDLAVDCIAYNSADVRQDLAILSILAGHLVLISTDFVYDPAHRRFPQTEETDFFLTEGYGGLKRQAELTLANDAPPGLAWTVLRPCHIYGPGSLLGCLPEHGRDPQLIHRLQMGETLRLVGGGHFLQQPILARDLASTILSCCGNPNTNRKIFNATGPDIAESREYYRLIAEELGVPLHIAEVPVDSYLAEHPESASFMCHRIYDLSRLQASGAAVPSTPLAEGLRLHVRSLLAG